MPNFAVLIPPSDDQQAGGNPFAPDMFDYRSSDTFNYFNVFNPERRVLVKALQAAVGSAGPEEIQAMLGLEGDALAKAVEATNTIFAAPLMSALKRYGPGALFTAMNFPGLPTGAQRRLLENGIVVSALFGLLRPDDLIPMYRLGMDAKVPGLGSVADYWKPRLSAELNAAVQGRIVWDFLTDAHHRAWDDVRSYARRILVRFYTKDEGDPEPMTEGMPQLYGTLANLIVKETFAKVDAIVRWGESAGYRYDESLSPGDEATKTTVIGLVAE